MTTEDDDATNQTVSESGSSTCFLIRKMDTDEACHKICDHIADHGGEVKLDQHQYQALAQMVLDVWENGFRVGLSTANAVQNKSPARPNKAPITD